MLLPEIPLALKEDPLPSEIVDFIDEAERRADQFYAAGLGLRYPKYVPSDPTVVYRALASLKESGQLRGKVFCEWGCGFGIASGMASLLGFKAYGIEIEEELSGRAVRLMDDLDISVEILVTSYLPDGFDESEGFGGKDLISHQSRTSSDGLIWEPEYDGLDPDEVDLFFVYPWPDQEEFMMDLFSAVATSGAILLMYQGDGDIAAFCHDESDY